MSKLEELIKEFCPNGVECKSLLELVDIHKGIQFNKKDMAKEGSYPVINGGIEPSGYIENYNEQENTITISQGGASAGYVNWLLTKFWAGAHCYVVKQLNNCILDNRYLFHFIKNNENILKQCQYGAGIPALAKSTIQELQIPLPALPVQREIVRILDSFTLYSAELTARRKQYEFYRDKLLNFDIEIEWKTIEEACNMSAGGDVPKDRFSREKTEQFYVPVYSNGVDENALYGYTDKAKIFEPCITVAARGTIGYCALRTEPFFPVVRLICLCPKKEIIPKYLKYYIETIHFQVPTSGIPQLTVPMIGKYKIPIPPIDVQERIVKVLDNFDAICSDLGIGLPAEIEKRQKQYEYYRNKLLSFDINVDKVINTTGGATVN